MTTKERVLAALEAQRDSAVSGMSLAQQLRVSRTSVWKAVCSLQKEGYLIDAVQNRGYTLHAGGSVLTETGIRLHLKHREIPVTVFQEVVSTNNTAKQMAAEGVAHGALVVADFQTGGRGRRGRSFLSPPGSGLYLSMVLRGGLPAQDAVRITGAAAVAACRAVEHVTGKRLDIKWVNDLYDHGKKCCGILTEAQTDFETGGVDFVVVGIGINLLEPEEGWPDGLRDTATAIFRRGEPVDRCRLAAAVADELLNVWDALPDMSFMDEYRARNIVPGRRVRILQAGSERVGEALCITEEGHLLVRLEDGTQEALSFGEVSIRMEPETHESVPGALS